MRPHPGVRDARARVLKSRQQSNSQIMCKVQKFIVVALQFNVTKWVSRVGEQNMGRDQTAKNSRKGIKHRDIRMHCNHSDSLKQITVPNVGLKDLNSRVLVKRNRINNQLDSSMEFRHISKNLFRNIRFIKAVKMDWCIMPSIGVVLHMNPHVNRTTYQQCIKSIDEGQRVVSKDIIDVDI